MSKISAGVSLLLATTMAMNSCRERVNKAIEEFLPQDIEAPQAEDYQDGRIIVGSVEGEGQVHLEKYLRMNFEHMIQRMEGFSGNQSNQEGGPVTLSDILSYLSAEKGQVLTLHFTHPNGVRPYFAAHGYLDEQYFGTAITVDETALNSTLQLTGGNPDNGFLAVLWAKEYDRSDITEGPAASWIREREQNNK